jgi:ketosteroid isomerase-like protein
MNRPKKLSVAVTLLVMIAAMTIVMLTITLPTADALGQQEAQVSDVDRIEAAGRNFIAAISARDIQAMAKLWAHGSSVTFIGPLSTGIVIGWNGVRKAWEMRFGQFDRVTISLTESHVRTNGKVAWAVGIEKAHLLRKNAETVSFDAFVTNVFEDHDDRWLIVSHQATPIFGEAK